MGRTDLGFQFDATQVEPNTGPPKPVPTGWYNVMITEGEVKSNKAGDGGYVELVLKILDGKYANRMVWDRLNLWNKNAMAVEIARGTFSAICHAVGVFQVNDVQLLYGKPLMARLVEVPPKDGYDAKNDVKGYAKTGEKQTEGGGGGPAAATGAADAPDAPPWQAGGDEKPAETPAAAADAPPAPPWAAKQEEAETPTPTPEPAKEEPAPATATPPWMQT